MNVFSWAALVGCINCVLIVVNHATGDNVWFRLVNFDIAAVNFAVVYINYKGRRVWRAPHH